MGTDYFIGGSIDVRPPVPAERLAGSDFVLRTDHSELPNEDRSIVLVTVAGATYSTIEPACPDGIHSCGSAENTADEVAEALTELVNLIGPGHTFGDALTFEGPNVDDHCRFRVVHRDADGDQPERWDVVTQSASLIYADDYTIPDGPAVRFDADAARAWLMADVGAGVPRALAHHSLNINPRKPYNTCDDSPGDYLAQMMPLLTGREPEAPDAWRVAPGVEIQVVETLSIDGGDRAGGGAVLVVDVGGLRVATGWIEARDLVSHGDSDNDGKTDITQVDAAVQALGNAADAVNALVEQHRMVRAADSHPSSVWQSVGPFAAELGAADIECALRTLAEIARNGLDDPHGELSIRQTQVAARLAALLAAEDDEHDDGQP